MLRFLSMTSLSFLIVKVNIFFLTPQVKKVKILRSLVNCVVHIDGKLDRIPGLSSWYLKLYMWVSSRLNFQGGESSGGSEFVRASILILTTLRWGKPFTMLEMITCVFSGTRKIAKETQNFSSLPEIFWEARQLSCKFFTNKSPAGVNSTTITSCSWLGSSLC